MTIEVVMVGLGYVALEAHSGGHLRQYMDDPEIDVIAGVDHDPAARRLALERGLPVTYDRFEHAVANHDFDYVSVLTPTDTHLEICRVVAGAGKHILCEKPISDTFQSAREIQEIVTAANVGFRVSMNCRLLAEARRVQDDIQSGLFGDVYLIDFDECSTFQWTSIGDRNVQYRCSSLRFWGEPTRHGLIRLITLDKAIHFLDLVDAWAGADVKYVHAQGGGQGPFNDAGENLLLLTLILSDGTRCRFFHHWGCHHTDRAGGSLATRVRIFGSKSLAILESDVQGASASYNVFRNDKLTTTISFPPSRRTDFADSLKQLHASQQEKTLQTTNLQTATRHLHVIEACYQSMSENRGVELKAL